MFFLLQIFDRNDTIFKSVVTNEVKISHIRINLFFHYYTLNNYDWVCIVGFQQYITRMKTDERKSSAEEEEEEAK